MKLNIDTLKFGNPSYAEQKLIQKNNYLDSVFIDFAKDDYNYPSGEKAIQEVNDTIVRLTDIQLSENEEALLMYSKIDRNFEQWFYNTAKSPRVDVMGKIQQLADDIDPIIVKLKYYFKRIRPNQFASNTKVKLFPISNYRNDTPSYPSRTVVLGCVFCEVLGNLIPDDYEKFMQIKEAIKNSRLYLGNNYQSDIAFAEKVADRIISNKEFLKKYNI